MIDLKGFKEEFAYVKYRNKSFKNAQTLKGELTRKYGDIDTGKLYTRIVEYQIKKYGMTLCRNYRVRDRRG